MSATSAAMAVNFSCATKEAAQSVTTRTALAVMSLCVASGSAHGTSVTSAASGQTYCALNVQIPTAKLMRLAKSQTLEMESMSAVITL